MDPRRVGDTIASLRKREKMTQAELAARLKISVKTVSKWETGQGYPEITQFPVMADLFGVSVDFLMTGARKGIMFAGNILVDVVKNVQAYPKKGMLSNIYSMSRAVGGCVPNTAINLAVIDRSIPLAAIGRVGDDEYGQFVVGQLQRHRIDTSRIVVSQTNPTSFSDVISEPTGERTFFHARGANQEFCPEDVDLSDCNGRILHAGYLLLLDKFDKKDPEYGTVMARFLHNVQQRGIKTSIDLVSSSTENYREIIVPALRYCNYAIVNELESCSIWSLEPRRADGSLIVENVRQAMERMAKAGVSDKVIVHSREAGFCLDCKTGVFSKIASLKIPKEEILGSVGAGDAFCAGCLYGIYTGMSDREMLEFASAAAACNLFSENSVDGMRPKKEILKLSARYGRQKLPE